VCAAEWYIASGARWSVGRERGCTIAGVDFDADLLTEALAIRLGAIVPDGFHVRAADGVLWYSADAGRFPGQLSNYHVGRSGTYVTGNLASYGETAEKRIAGVAAQALDELQDYVDEASHDPWPGMRIPPRSFAVVRGGALHLWYGGPDITSPALLACEPIPLTEIR
jgi:hypothetical protein